VNAFAARIGLWLWRAWRADPESVQRWRDEDFASDPRGGQGAEGATIYFGDEAQIRSDYPRRHRLGTGRADSGGQR
jgi:hypothetical protein